MKIPDWKSPWNFISSHLCDMLKLIICTTVKPYVVASFCSGPRGGHGKRADSADVILSNSFPSALISGEGCPGTSPCSHSSPNFKIGMWYPHERPWCLCSLSRTFTNDASFLSFLLLFNSSLTYAWPSLPTSGSPSSFLVAENLLSQGPGFTLQRAHMGSALSTNKNGQSLPHPLPKHSF